MLRNDFDQTFKRSARHQCVKDESFYIDGLTVSQTFHSTGPDTRIANDQWLQRPELLQSYRVGCCFADSHVRQNGWVIQCLIQSCGLSNEDAGGRFGGTCNGQPQSSVEQVDRIVQKCPDKQILCGWIFLLSGGFRIDKHHCRNSALPEQRRKCPGTILSRSRPVQS